MKLSVLLLTFWFVSAQGRLGQELQSQRNLKAPQMYGELACNAIAAIDSADCLSNGVPFSQLVAAATTNGDSVVVVPCGTCATVDTTDGSTVTLPSGGLDVVGRLHFPSTANLVLRTPSVVVQGIWDMEVPAAGNQVNISLFGTDNQFAYPHAFCGAHPLAERNTCAHKQSLGKKPFGVVGGKVDIHAIDPACPSWTKLKAATGDAAGQARHFTVDAAFGACLRAGDDLLLTSDTLSHKQESVSVVESIATDSTTGDAVITIVGSLTRELATLAGPGEPEFAVEVAGLRRDVIFQAEADDPNRQHGGHLIVFHTSDVVQTIQGVQFENFGQEGNLGRYPIHFHKCANAPGLVSKNVINNSNQRCIVIHNTNRVTVDDNVAHIFKGHCFSTETGNEELNTFTSNLGAYGKLLDVGVGQSDKPGFHHQASTFWIRSMMNTFVGNVAAGSASVGFWLEMKDKKGDQLELSPSSFRDNVAHSNFQGLLTYKKGWQPRNGGSFDNFTTYKNDVGIKMHITGNVAVKNSLIADNKIGVRYGVWNRGVDMQNTVIVANSNDAKLRLGKTCPIMTAGIRPSYNTSPSRKGAIRLKNVTFAEFTCGKKPIELYFDGRLSKDMGDPLQATDVTIVNSNENSKPFYSCGASYSTNVFLQDVNGTLGPQGKGSGFIIRDNNRMKAFLPDGQCETMPYGGGCSAFCEDVCLRMVKITPSTQRHTTLVLADASGLTTKTFSYPAKKGGFQIVLPPGSYHGYFEDENGVELVARSVVVEAYRKPTACGDYVKKSSFTFNTAKPSSSPLMAPSLSSAPSVTPDETVKFRSSVGRYIFATSNGNRGLRASDDPVIESIFTLKPANCPTPHSSYPVDHKGTQCYFLNVEGRGKKFDASTGGVWTGGIRAIWDQYRVYADQKWHLVDTECFPGAAAGAVCVYLRNAYNGRSLYDTGSHFGASPKGRFWAIDKYRWEKIPA